MSSALKQSETVTVLNETAFSGVSSVPFYVVSGSRMLVTVLVTAIDSGASISTTIENGFSSDDPYDLLDTIINSSLGREKRVYSDFHNRFKITSTVSGGNASFKVAVTLADNALSTKIENAQISVDLTHLEDSIKIGDGVRLLVLNPDGSVPVSDGSSANQTRIDRFNEVSLVATGSETLILSYTVPVGMTAELYRCQCSGENIAKYLLYKQGTLIGVKRTYFGAPLNTAFEFGTSNKKGLQLQAGDIIEIKVIHNRPDPADFEADFQIIQTV